MIEQKQLQNVEYFHYLSNMIINDARRTRGIKFRISMKKQVPTRRRLFASKLKLNLRKKIVKC
jgi:hypothetical protein